MRKVPMLSLGATLLATSAVLAQGVISARPGMLNYVEGTASIADAGGQPVSLAAGKTMLGAGQVLQTTDGRAEMLLTPGVYARLGENSAIRMVSPVLTRTELALERGRVELEVDDIYKQNDLLVDIGDAQVRLAKRGLYEFDAEDGTVRTLYGEAQVRLNGGAPATDVKGGRVLALSADEAKPEKFDEKHYTDALTDWSSLRSEYLGQANQEVASTYATNGIDGYGLGYGAGYAGYGYGGFGPGWAWSPGLLGYTWLPGAGLAWSPFGYGFYSAPYLYGGGFVYGPGVYGGGFGTGFYSHPYRRSFANAGVNPGLAGHPLGPGTPGNGLAGRGIGAPGGVRPGVVQSGLAAGAFHGGAVPAGGFHGSTLPAGGYRVGGPVGGGFHGQTLPAGTFHGGGTTGGYHGGGAPAGGGFHGGGMPAGGGGVHGGAGHAGGGGGGHR